MDILTTAAQSYMNTFSGYVGQFLTWGQWLFFSLLTINIVWICLWHAFDRHSIVETMPKFIKQFFLISLFYTFMLHPSWLALVMQTVQSMGNNLTHMPIDPSSLISEGIGLANKIILPVVNSSFLTHGFGLIIATIVYIIIMFVFISIALDLALTLIITTALISVASFFLGFAALGATTQIARQALDVILANCIKILGIYLVVASGTQTISSVVALIPDKIISFDPYCWIVAVVLLFWLIAKNLPVQLAKIVTGVIQESHGTDAAALAMAVVGYAKLIGGGRSSPANVNTFSSAGAASSAAAHFNTSGSSSGLSAPANTETSKPAAMAQAKESSTSNVSRPK